MATGSWQVLSNETGSMTRELFVEFVDYFCDRMEAAGYGKKHGPVHNCEVYLDGHTSRWTLRGLMKMIARGFFPFCIPSHTSAWWQPNDDGPNGQLKGILGHQIHEWRQQNPFGIFDRGAYNACLSAAVMIMKQRLAANLAAWKAKVKVWMEESEDDFEDDDSDDDCPPLVSRGPAGKPGNVITRAWERCGWHPLRRLSPNWEKVLPTLGARYEEAARKLVTDQQKKMLPEKQVRIRELAWEGYKQNFLDLAESLKAETEKRKARRHTSVVDTRFGKGFTCKDDLDFLKEFEEKKRKEAEVTPQP